MKNVDRVFEYICWLSVDGMVIAGSNEIGRALCLKKHRVNAHIKSLVGSGLISVIRRKTDGGRDLQKLILINEQRDVHVPLSSALRFIEEKDLAEQLLCNNKEEICK